MSSRMLIQHAIALVFITIGSRIGIELIDMGFVNCTKHSQQDPSCYSNVFNTGMYYPICGAVVGYLAYLFIAWMISISGFAQKSKNKN